MAGNTFASLTPLVKDKELEERLAKANKLLPTSPVSRALFNSCVVDVHVLLKGHEDANPSLLRLVRPFLRKNAQRTSRYWTSSRPSTIRTMHFCAKGSALKPSGGRMI
jgi:hypothetical protein